MSSTHNYMDNVPVKIAENYKPPPRVYQLPQAIANKLQLPAEHYNEAPQYSYDFQLERKVLSKMGEWRRMRQLEREARRERIEKRELLRLRALEMQQKQLLGAVSYPSAEDLSSTESGDDEELEKDKKSAITKTDEIESNVVQELPPRSSTQPSSFHNILQPTILPRQEGGNVATYNTLTHAGNVFNAGKLSNVFNYKDFEEDTSSPFDSVELKTINDLDILAQVLHNTQLKAAAGREQESQPGIQIEQVKESAQHAENIENSNAASPTCKMSDGEVNLTIIENNKAALEKVDFNGLSEQLHNENIPVPSVSNSYVYQTQNYTPAPFTNYMSHHQQYTNFNQLPAIHNQNYLYNNAGNGSAYFSPTHTTTSCATQLVTHNANANANYTGSNLIANAAFTSPQPLPVHAQLAANELNSRSKSVPDILKELSEEVHNSQMRRSRNNSTNLDTGKHAVKHEEETGIRKQSQSKMSKKQETQIYPKLEASTQKLAKNISSMGFPLERVAKIAQMYGADDKRIVEHLIPLSELMDLGFDESKISEALMKFDNNKEKALEYLIS